MQTFKLTIITPDMTLLDEEVMAAIFPGIEGSFEILANHAPMVSMVRPGAVEITGKDGQKFSVDITGGFFEFQKNAGVLLCTPAHYRHGA